MASPIQEIPQDNLLCKIDVSNLICMRRVMEEIYDRFTSYVLRPSNLKGEDAMFVNKIFASIRIHPKDCLMLLWATYMFVESRHYDDDSVRRAISYYQSLGSERVLLSSAIYPAEHAELVANFAACYGSAYRMISLSTWKRLTPTVFDNAQIISAKRAGQLDRIARRTGRDATEIPKEEALGPLPQHYFLGSGNIQTFNSGPCNECRRREKFCNKMEPFCQECRWTWNECCSYSTATAGTVQEIEAARKAMQAERSAKLAEQRLKKTKIDKQSNSEEDAEGIDQWGSDISGSRFGNDDSNNSEQSIQSIGEDIEEDGTSPMLNKGETQKVPLGFEPRTRRSKNVSLPTHSSKGVEYASITTPFDEDYPSESSLSPLRPKVSNPFPKPEFSGLKKGNRGKIVLKTGGKRTLAEYLEEKQNDGDRASTTRSLTLANTPTSISTLDIKSSGDKGNEAEEDDDAIVASDTEPPPVLHVSRGERISRRRGISRDQPTAQDTKMNVGATQIPVKNGISKKDNDEDTSSRITRGKSRKPRIGSVGEIEHQNENHDDDVFVERDRREKERVEQPGRITRSRTNAASLQATSTQTSSANGNQEIRRSKRNKNHSGGSVSNSASIDSNPSQHVKLRLNSTQNAAQQVVPTLNGLTNLPYFQSTREGGAYKSPYLSQLDGKDLYSNSSPSAEPQPQYLPQNEGARDTARNKAKKKPSWSLDEEEVFGLDGS